MFGVNNFLTHLTKLSSHYQTVRWLRKPRKPFWLGTAKTKQFYIPDIPPQSSEEKDELTRLYNIYRTNRKSLKQFILSQSEADLSVTVSENNLVSAEEIEASLKENDVWNSVSASIRAVRLEKQSKEYEERVINVMEFQDNKKAELESKAAELIRLEKERSKTFITEENIDKAIEECLATTVDYNFAIDLQGNIIKNSSNT